MLCVGAWLPAAAQPLRIGIYENEPKVFTDASGEAAGIFVDLTREMAEREGWTLEFVRCEWDACLRALQRGELDLLPDVAYSDRRARTLDFHRQPALLSWSQVYVREDTGLLSLFQLQEKRVAVLRNSVQHETFAKMADAFGVDVHLVPVADLAHVFELTARNEADAAIANHRYGLLHGPRYGLEATPIVFDPAQLYFATAKGRHADLLAAIDRWLVDWRQDDTSPYYDIVRRWEKPLRQPLVPVGFWWGLGGVIALMLLALAAAAWLRREVATKTRHLQESERKLATILDTVGACIFIKDRALRYVYANRQTQELFARPVEAIIGKGDEAFFDATTAEQLQASDRRVIEAGERVTSEDTNTTADNAEKRTYLAVKIPLRDTRGRIYGLCGIATDISERKRNEEAIYRLAYFDTLTGLPNRSLLMKQMSESLSTASETSIQGLIYIDLDDFKDLNDLHGHAVGDDLLRDVAQRLRTLMQSEEQLARLGGDEFAILLKGLSSKPDQARIEAERLAQRILAILKEAYRLGDFRHHGTCSIGVAMVEERGEDDAEELLKRAELAMYQAKRAGRNTIRFFDAEVRAAVAARIVMEADLRTALSEEQFRLVYQPQVDAEQRVIGAEALVRWDHPLQGEISPGEFIPVAESSGLILGLGRLVLSTACYQLAKWEKDASMAHLTLAVNVSTRQFRSVGFVDDLLTIIQETGAPRSRLKLELTETVLIEDLEEAAETITTLSRLGICVSLDDFGTGYSSLAYLKLLPLSQLKIDQSFVRDVLEDPAAAAIARSVVGLGKSLEVEVIAEGVETTAQLEFLSGIGCRLYQGYLFGRPTEVEALERLAGRLQGA
ncbi:EAL domain-containing protein [Billgrantia diversa]|nr:EAL domain-containing protein [Halomonas sp. MCCC 1A13316]